MYKVVNGNGAVAWTPAILRQIGRSKRHWRRRRQSNEWKIVTSYSSETCSPGETQCRDTLHRAIRRQGVGTEGQEFPVMLRPDTPHPALANKWSIVVSQWVERQRGLGPEEESSGFLSLSVCGHFLDPMCFIMKLDGGKKWWHSYYWETVSKWTATATIDL